MGDGHISFFQAKSSLTGHYAPSERRSNPINYPRSCHNPLQLGSRDQNGASLSVHQPYVDDGQTMRDKKPISGLMPARSIPFKGFPKHSHTECNHDINTFSPVNVEFNPPISSLGSQRKFTHHRRKRMGQHISPPVPPLPSPLLSSEGSMPITRSMDTRRYCRIDMRCSPDWLQSEPCSPASESSDDPSCASSASSATFGLPTLASTESESSQEMHFEFPQPPPLSPLLRRMKSSPAFKHVQSQAIDQLLDRRKRSSSLHATTLEPVVHIPKPRTIMEEHTAPSFMGPHHNGEDYSWVETSPAISTNGKFGFQQWLEHGPNVAIRDTFTASLEPIVDYESQDLNIDLKLQRGKPHDLHLAPPEEIYDDRSKAVYRRSVTPKAVRKVASAKDSFSAERAHMHYSHVHEQIAEHHPSIPVTQEHFDRSSALNRLELSIEKLKAYSPDLHHSVRRTRHLRCASTGSDLRSPSRYRRRDSVDSGCLFVPTPSVAQEGQKLPRSCSRQQVSVSSSFNSIPANSSKSISVLRPSRVGGGFLANNSQLGAPFEPQPNPILLREDKSIHHHGKKFHKRAETVQVQPNSMSSFMDVDTPEREPLRRQPSLNKKVKKLLVRASLGFSGWSRSLARVSTGGK